MRSRARPKRWLSATSLRRAVVVFTDGQDTASRLTPSEVSGIASSIDVPVYIIGIVPSIDNPSADIASTAAEQSALAGALSNLADWTGGETFVVSTIAERSVDGAAARRRTASSVSDRIRGEHACRAGIRSSSACATKT